MLISKNAFKIPPAPHQPVEQSKEPGETCHMDIFGPLKTTPKEHGRDIRLSYTYEKNSDTPQNKYEYVEKPLPSLEQIFNKVLNNLKRSGGIACRFEPKFEGPYRVIERFSNVNYRVQHVEQLRKRFNTHVNRMIPFIKRFSHLHLNNLDDLQPDETEVKGIVPSPRFANLKEGRSDGRSPVPKVAIAVFIFALFTGNGFLRNVGASGSMDLMAGKVMFLRSNQGGRLDGNESIAVSFRSDLVGFKSWSGRISGFFTPSYVCQKNPPVGKRTRYPRSPSVALSLSQS
ncbi:integrase catalytic domain-containing protein [Trichonephila clavipes]|nr:integrase catalytic domain-containing protein [Trichonephila clavipes]